MHGMWKEVKYNGRKWDIMEPNGTKLKEIKGNGKEWDEIEWNGMDCMGMRSGV